MPSTLTPFRRCREPCGVRIVKETLAFLCEMPYFARLDHRVMQEIATRAYRRIYQPGELLSLEGEPCTVVHVVIEGTVRIYKVSLEGREQVMDRLGPGRMFHLVPVFDGGGNPASADAATRVAVLVFPRDEFLDIVATHSSVALAILRDFAERLRHFTGLIEDLSLRTATGRLAKLLLEQAGVGDEAPRRLTQQEMAAHLGTVREVVGRALARFQRDGLVRLERHRIIIVDREGLRKIATV